MSNYADFLLQLLRQLEEGKVQETADDIHRRLHDMGLYTLQIKVGEKLMADEFDRASDMEELMRQSALNHQRNKARPAAQATGQCLFCYADVPTGYRWCDAECRDDWEKEQAAR